LSLRPLHSFVLAVFFATSAHAGERGELDALRGRLDRLRSELSSSEGMRSEAREELRESERAISNANRAIREHSRRSALARAELAALSARKRAAEEEVEARQGDLGRLLAASYVNGNPGYLELLLSGGNPNQTARELHYYSHISRAHAALIRSLRANLDRVSDLESQARAKTAEIDSIERSQKMERDELVRQHGAHRKVLVRVSALIREQRREVKSLERDEARLSKLIQEIGRAIADMPLGGKSSSRVAHVGEAAAGPLNNLKGSLHLPVRGILAHRYGTPRAGGGPTWKGLFIRAREGDEVRAVAAGRVVFADWMRGYGNLLIVDHGRGFLSVYGNTESVLKGLGDEVQSAEVVATVGASGGGDETGLYFEIRHDGKAFDPLSWVTLR
jgi:septal ring factor EnvC (AmiA/AmiB activator)